MVNTHGRPPCGSLERKVGTIGNLPSLLTPGEGDALTRFRGLWSGATGLGPLQATQEQHRETTSLQLVERNQQRASIYTQRPQRSHGATMGHNNCIYYHLWNPLGHIKGTTPLGHLMPKGGTCIQWWEIPPRPNNVACMEKHNLLCHGSL